MNIRILTAYVSLVDLTTIVPARVSVGAMPPGGLTIAEALALATRLQQAAQQALKNTEELESRLQ
jgi:hypothetical protein